MTDQQAETKRGLEPKFLADLNKGMLSPLLSFVKADNTLMLAIRDNYINIYYRGGSILKLTWDKAQYIAIFDPNYAEPGKRSPEAEEINLTKDEKLGRIKLPHFIEKDEKIQEWLDAFPSLKRIMDKWLTKHEKLEREFQQLVVRENNFSRLANQTDYFIVDIEAAYPDAHARFDLLAAKWPATQQERKKDKVSLAIIEMKYGEKSLTGATGLIEHLKNLETLIRNPKHLQVLRDTIALQLTQLNELGLLKHTRTENRDFEVTEEKPEVILLLAGYPPKSQNLRKLLEEEPTKKEFKNYAHQDAPFDLKFHWPHSAGYGLFIEDMIPLECFQERLNALKRP